MSDFTTRDETDDDEGAKPAESASQQTTHWDEVAQQLGAEVSPEALTRVQRKPDESSTPPPAPGKRSPQQRKENKPTSPSHWTQLAGSLGITPPPEPTPLSESTAPSAQERSGSEHIESDEDVDIDDIEEATIDDKVTPIDWDVPSAGDSVVDEAQPHAEPRSESSAVSAFWSIFGGFSSAPTRPHEPPQPPSHDERDDVETVRFSRRDREVSFDEEPDFESPEPSRTEGEDEEQQESRGRRPRRRRGRRGGRRRRGVAPAQDESAVTEELGPSAELFEDADFGDRDVADESRDVELAEGMEDLADEVELDDTAPIVREDAGGRRSHRKIPSWKDAVGIIVTKNLESRTANSGSGSSRRRRGGRRRPSR